MIFRKETLTLRMFAVGGERREFVRKVTEDGIPRCLVCGKPIPIQSVCVVEQDAPRRSRFFCSDKHATVMAELMMEDLVRPEPVLDVPDPKHPGRFLAGPLLAKETRMAREAAKLLGAKKKRREDDER